MPSNDLHLLDARLDARRRRTAASMTPDAFFTLFCSEVILRNEQPGVPALLQGIVDGQGDCGVDAIYCFVDGQLLTPAWDLETLPREPQFEIHIIQTKRSPRFTEEAFDKLQVHLPELLDLSPRAGDLSSRVHPQLLDATALVVDACLAAAHKSPDFHFAVHYATRADGVHPNTKARGDALAETLRAILPEATAQVHFYGAKELLHLSRRQDKIQKTLPIAAAPIASESDRGQGYVALVDVDAWFRFMCEPDSTALQSALFEANVRDHYSTSLVNDSIAKTLRSTASPEFWWLNNGITIVATKATHMGNCLYLDNPQIVNGLQTSNEIYSFCRAGGEGRGRQVLVRVIKAADESVRDAIIWATNNQNALPPSALRATEPLQHSIEEYLRSKNFFYDRRKNSQLRNDKVQVERIISMEFLAQCMTACLLREPWRARREIGLFDDKTYPRIFSDDIPLGTYYASLVLVRRIRELLALHPHLKSSPIYIEDYVFQCATVATMLLTRQKGPSASDIANVDPDRLHRHAVSDLTRIVAAEYSQALSLVSIRPESSAATSQHVSEALLDRASRLLNSRGLVGWPEKPMSVDPRSFGAASSNSPSARARIL